MTDLHVVAETPSYLGDARHLTDEERRAIVHAVAKDPKAGVEVKGSGGVRKIRIGGRGKGKSGGFRVIVAWLGENAPVYLVALLSKSDKANFTASEVAGFKKLTTEIKKYWRLRRS
jgi:hypothetical protein